MRIGSSRAQFGMELPGDKPRMVGQLDDLHEIVRRADAAEYHAVFLQRVLERIVHLEAVPMPFSHKLFLVCFVRLRPFWDGARINA